MVYNWLKNSLFAALPVRCQLCGQPSTNRQMVCPDCLPELPQHTHSCRQCAEPLSSATPALCGQCLQHPPAFDRVISQFAYAPPIDKWVGGMKFHQQWYFARLFGELLAEHLAKTECERPEAIVPVPLHARRLRERGYNQSLEIARHVARRLRVPLIDDLCIRSRATAAQTGLSASERRRNLRGAFRLRKTARYRHLVLLDDVVTTGSTSNALAQVLKTNGVERVDVWCVARASNVR